MSSSTRLTSVGLQALGEHVAAAQARHDLETWDALMKVVTDESANSALGWALRLSPERYDALIAGIEARGSWAPKTH